MNPSGASPGKDYPKNEFNNRAGFTKADDSPVTLADRAAEAAIHAAGKGQRLLLLVDGTDKIPLKQAQSLFLEDTEQLLGIQALVLYTAPITLKYVGTTHSKLNSELVLPIIKLASRDGQPFEPGWQAMHDLLDRRIDPGAFASPDLRDRLIETSGGHPRELLRLLALSCEAAEGDTIESAPSIGPSNFSPPTTATGSRQKTTLCSPRWMHQAACISGTTNAPATCSGALRCCSTTTAPGDAPIRSSASWKAIGSRRRPCRRRGSDAHDRPGSGTAGFRCDPALQ